MDLSVLRGPAGAPGAAGPAGAQGARGYSLLSGAGPPPPGLGQDGEFYIDVATTQMYGPKAEGVWGSPTNLTWPSSLSDPALQRWQAAAPEAMMVGAIVRDAAGAVTHATVTWPDGTAGLFTGVPSTEVPGALDAYTVSYESTPVRVYRQLPVARDPDTGAVVDRPSITID